MIHPTSSTSSDSQVTPGRSSFLCSNHDSTLAETRMPWLEMTDGAGHISGAFLGKFAVFFAAISWQSMAFEVMGLSTYQQRCFMDSFLGFRRKGTLGCLGDGCSAKSSGRKRLRRVVADSSPSLTANCQLIVGQLWASIEPGSDMVLVWLLMLHKQKHWSPLKQKDTEIILAALCHYAPWNNPKVRTLTITTVEIIRPNVRSPVIWIASSNQNCSTLQRHDSLRSGTCSQEWLACRPWLTIARMWIKVIKVYKKQSESCDEQTSYPHWFAVPHSTSRSSQSMAHAGNVRPGMDKTGTVAGPQNITPEPLHVRHASINVEWSSSTKDMDGVRIVCGRKYALPSWAVPC